MDKYIIEIRKRSIGVEAGVNTNNNHIKIPPAYFAQPAGYFNFAAKYLLYRASGI